MIQPIAGEEVAAFLAEVAVRRHGEQTVVVDANARYFGARLKSDSLVTGPGAMLGSIEF